ncbi:hypothetical protein L3556_00845 [Candidatus Synechococcus calcipolaris G9]|uniref:Uncharacterized protein n=1 Tax=Candidatus Synechococcus calcipolaris G9 TaxID=1497997 RepID=A0ABT6EUC7_9SYNE|nr:hypothetical protein [Candidatus Synechococcus calcipolaris]MDG2989485.1 hypothetical protein [Candidatus Synechococcus calcipolaris G9]
MSTIIYDDITLLDTFTYTGEFTGGNYVLFLTPDLEIDEGLEFPVSFVVKTTIEDEIYKRKLPGSVFVDTQEILLIPPQLSNSVWYLSLSLFSQFRLTIHVF